MIANASVSLTEHVTHVTLDKTDSSGVYVFPNINVGTYSLTVSRAGFRDLYIDGQRARSRQQYRHQCEHDRRQGKIEGRGPCRRPRAPDRRPLVQADHRLHRNHRDAAQRPTHDGPDFTCRRLQRAPTPGRLHRKQIPLPVQSLSPSPERTAMPSPGAWMAATTTTTWATPTFPFPFPTPSASSAWSPPRSAGRTVTKPAA